MEAPKKNVLFEEDSLESKRVINQTGVRARMPKLEEAYGANACWDGIVAPDGRFYYPLSSENGYCLPTKLGYFDYDQDKVITCSFIRLEIPMISAFIRLRGATSEST